MALHAPRPDDALTTTIGYEATLAQAGESGDAIVELRAHLKYGADQVHLGRPIKALETLSRAEELITSAEPGAIPNRLRSLVHCYKGLALGFECRFDDARAAHSQALTIAEQSNLDDLEFRSRINVGYSNLQLGDTAAAMHAYQTALSSRAPDHPYYGLGLIVLGDLFIEMGDLEAAERQVNEAIDYLSAKWISWGQHRIRLALARIHGKTGAAELAAELLDAAQSDLELTDTVGQAQTSLAIADLALFNLDVDRLRTCYQQTDELVPNTWFPKTALVMLIEALVETGEHSDADDYAERLIPDELPFLIRHRLLEARRKLSIERGDWRAAYEFLERTRPDVPLRPGSGVLQSQNSVSYPLSLNLSNVVDLSARYRELHRNVEIAQTAAHDLRTPFQSSLLLIDLLRSQIGSQFDESFDMLADELERANSILNEMHRLTDVNRGDGPQPGQVIGCEAAALAAISRIKPILNGKNQTATFANTASDPMVGFDRHVLEQVLDNLLSNASKYSNPGTEIRVTVSDGVAGRTELTVTDQGLGFTPADIANAFGYQRTLSASPTGDERASGLGLYITKQVLDSVGASISISSPGPDGGSVVIVSLDPLWSTYNQPGLSAPG